MKDKYAALLSVLGVISQFWSFTSTINIEVSQMGYFGKTVKVQFWQGNNTRITKNTVPKSCPLLKLEPFSPNTRNFQNFYYKYK